MLVPLFISMGWMSLDYKNNTSILNSNSFIKGSIIQENNQNDYIAISDIKIEYTNIDNSLFFAILEYDKDWWEYFKVGKLRNKEISWMKIENPPTEQSVLEARFVSLQGFSNPMIEVYGKTHAGHGAVYFYEIKNNQLNLLLKTQAVDFNSDISWAPDNYEKYGYGNCGEVFSGGKLASDFDDLNNDGKADIVLMGTEEIICEKETSETIGDLKTVEIKVASIPARKVFLWDESKEDFLEQ